MGAGGADGWAPRPTAALTLLSSWAVTPPRVQPRPPVPAAGRLVGPRDAIAAELRAGTTDPNGGLIGRLTDDGGGDRGGRSDVLPHVHQLQSELLKS